ncbi:MAG: ABC transporter ATP-binding protein [Candidatus Bathyarchaeia archaeon]
MAHRVVEVEGLTKRFRDVLAVNHVDFHVDKGEFLVILGPSGSGKSTLLMMIAGFIKPDEGEIYIDGELVNDKPPYERNVGMVFQNLALFPHMTVYDNVAFPLKMKRFDPSVINDKVEEILEIVRLSGLEDRRIHELSGGQRQRVALARTLVFKPSILLLDEPFGALDRKLRDEMQMEMRKLHDELNATSLLVTHDQREALVLADEIMVMRDGRIEQKGFKREVYFKPKTAFVASFMGLTNILNGHLKADEKGYYAEISHKIKVRIPSLEKKMDRVHLAIKAQDVIISEAVKPIFEEEDNLFEGRIIGEVFEGPDIIYEVALTEGLTLKAVTASNLPLNPKVGDRVYITIDPGRMTILEE